MYRTALFVLLAVFQVAPAQDLDPKKYALLVGINQYDHSHFKALEYAEADAKEMHDLLKASGYEVDLLLGKQATKEAITRMLKGLQEKGNQPGVVLIGLAGHGQQIEGESDSLFIPFDAKVQRIKRDGKEVLGRDGFPLLEADHASCVRLNEILTAFHESKAGSRILLADCCRNDPASARGRGFGSKATRDKLPQNTVVLFSCASGQESFEGPQWKHGVFYYHVLEGLRKGLTTDSKLFAYLEDAVPGDAKRFGPQQPSRLINANRIDFQLTLAVDEPKPGEERVFQIHPKLKMKFCWIPGGECQLGSTKTERDEVHKLLEIAEKQLRLIGGVLGTKEERAWLAWLLAESEEKRGKYKTQGFWLGKYEVMQEEWEGVMGNNPSQFSKTGSLKEQRERVAGLDTSRFPVDSVSWDDCQLFLKKCELKGFEIRLPHEDEWEYAYRGGKGNKQAFYWGNVLNGDKANHDGTEPYGTTEKGPYLKRPSEVGSYEKLAPHPWRLCDMSGNVWEWCDNLFEVGGVNRNNRGGGWTGAGRGCRATERSPDAPVARGDNLGFRVALIPSSK